MDLKSNPKCCVCGKPSDRVVCTGLGPMSDAYCQECAEAGLQSWLNITATAWCIGAQSLDDCAPHFRHAIETTINSTKYTLEDLWKDVRDTQAQFLAAHPDRTSPCPWIKQGE